MNYAYFVVFWRFIANKKVGKNLLFFAFLSIIVIQTFICESWMRRKKKKMTLHEKLHHHLHKHFHRHIHKVLHIIHHLQHHLFHGAELLVVCIVTLT